MPSATLRSAYTPKENVICGRLVDENSSPSGESVTPYCPGRGCTVTNTESAGSIATPFNDARLPAGNSTRAKSVLKLSGWRIVRVTIRELAT